MKSAEQASYIRKVCWRPIRSETSKLFRCLLVLPDGFGGALSAEPAIRKLAQQGPDRMHLGICHRYADLYGGHPAVRELVYAVDEEMDEKFQKVIPLRLEMAKGNPMNWVFDAAKQLGVTVPNSSPQIELSSVDLIRIQRFGLNRLSGPLVAFSLCEGGCYGGPGPDQWMELCQVLRSEIHTGLVLLGTEKTLQLENDIDLRGRLIGRETAAVLSQCDLLVSNDADLVWLAEAVSVPSVFVYASEWQSYQCPKFASVTSVQASLCEDVLKAVRATCPEKFDSAIL